MKILDLTSLENSEIKYKISPFPDGQQNIVLLEYELELLGSNRLQPVTIKSRLNNWQDLELITCATACLRELQIEEIHLYTPYIVGARSDRKFEQGGNNYLKDVICPAINSLEFKTVTCIDPHSDILEACIKRFRKIDNSDLVHFAGTEICLGSYSRAAGEIALINWSNFIFVSPDAGASKKIYKIADKIGYDNDIIICSKDRDENGKLTKCVIPLLPYTSKDIIIIDDICDGGATFINIAKAIKNIEGFNNKIYLIVTHGIFSKGFEELSEYFDGIYCTNSYKDLDDTVNGEGKYKNWVKQLNVF